MFPFERIVAHCDAFPSIALRGLIGCLGPNRGGLREQALAAVCSGFDGAVRGDPTAPGSKRRLGERRMPVVVRFAAGLPPVYCLVQSSITLSRVLCSAALAPKRDGRSAPTVVAIRSFS